jgi:sporulation protein YlmC with PRC-barrel domain
MDEPQMGAEVEDKNGKSLGNIDYVVRDTWSGDIRKFIVYKKPPEADLSFTVDDAAEITREKVKLNIAVE